GGVTAAEWSPDGKKLLLLAASGEKRFIVGNPDDPTARQIRDYTWRFDGLGVRDEFTSVWITDLDEPNPTCITAPSYNVDGAAWSPDGKHIAFLADRSENAGLEEIDAVWTMPAAGGEPTQVARLESGELSLAWTPGDQIAFVGVDRPGFPGWADMELHVSDGKSTQRLAADLHLNIQSTSYGDYQDGEQFGPPPLLWQDEQSLVALVSHHGYSHPYRFGVDGSVQALAEPEATCSSIAAGGGRIAVIAATTDQPNDIFAVEDGELRRLTTDGSSWYGPFQRRVERKKVGIMGLSYGGFMTNYMLARHPGVFAAAVSENPVTDLLGEWATSDFGRYIGRRAVEAQNPWDQLDAYLSRSPFVRIHQNRAPLLLL